MLFTTAMRGEKIRDRTVALVNFADEFRPVTDPGGGEA
jgi:hypothetical protein